MKRKLYKILGVGLAFVVIASLFGFAVPVSADPGNVVWEPVPIPAQGLLGGYTLNIPVMSTGPIASIGNTLYVATWDDLDNGGAGDIDAGEIMIYKSVDGGCTWARTGYNTDTEVLGSAAPAQEITDICIVDANTVYVTNGWDVFKTIDGGANWIPLTNLANWIGGFVGPGTEWILAIDVGVIGTDTYVFAGVSDGHGAAANNGGAYVCWEWALGMPWHNLLVDTNRPPTPTGWGAGTADVYDIRADPNNFATTQGVLAIAHYDGTGGLVCDPQQFTVFTTKHLGHEWDSFVGDAAFLFANTAGNYITNPYRAEMWLPENFDYYLLPVSGMEIMVGIASFVATEGDVYQVIGGVPSPIPVGGPVPGSFPFDLNIGATIVAAAVNVTGLDGAGVSGAATLLAAGDIPGAPAVPQLFRSATNGALWFPGAKAPTGAASPFLANNALPTVTCADDFATSGQAWVATHGADCGVSITNDFGTTCNTIGLINSDIDLLTDFSVSADGSTMFLATDDTALTPFGGVNFGATGVNSIWRFGNGNTCTWERIWSSTLSAPSIPSWVELSPDGTALFICHPGAAPAAPQIFRSLDLGQSFLPQITLPGGNDGVPNNVNSWVVINQNTIAIGTTVLGVGGIVKTTNNGVIWSEIPAFLATPPVGNIVIAPGYTDPGAMLISDTGGAIALSPDGGFTWIPLPPTGLVAAQAYCAFDINYATNGYFYATSSNAAGGVARYEAALLAWLVIDGQGQGNASIAIPDEFPVPAGSGILSTAGCGPESVLYATSGVATALAGTNRVGAMFRCLNPTASMLGPVLPYWENAPEGLALGQTFLDTTAIPQNWLWSSDGVGSTTLYSIDSNGPNMGLYRYTDTLADCVTLIAPADGDMITEPMPIASPWRVTLEWAPLVGAIDYQVQVDIRPDFLGGLPGLEFITYVPGSTSATFTLVRNVSENTTFYWRVRVAFSANFGAGVPGLGYGAPVRSYWSDTWEFTTSPPPPDWININVMPPPGAQNVAINTTFQWEQVWGATHYEWQLADDSTFANILDSQMPDLPFCQAAITLAYDTTYAWRVRAMADTVPVSDWVVSSFHTEIEPTGPVDVSDVTIPPVEEITPVWIWVIIAIGAVLVILVVILIWFTRQGR
jgi:photosystem II stability/assembly factor-like uncharacterized protein